MHLYSLRLKSILRSARAARAVLLLLTIALHALLLTPALSRVGLPGPREARAEGHASALTWIELASSNAPTFAPSLPAEHLQSVRIDVPQGDSTIVEQDDSASEYVRQMAVLTARIQGMWKLPRTRLAADFHCRARLRPGESGSIEEVELESCDDSGPARASIARAIEHAMPLPLPRSTDIVLQFTAYAQADGASRTSIEPAAD